MGLWTTIGLTKTHASVVILFLICLNTASGQCSEGRFGSNCQYICHCKDNSKCDSVSGECSNGKCEVRWFGPGCQYRDVGYTGDGPLNDADDTTCLSSSTKLDFPISEEVRLTWIRFVTRKSDMFKNVKLVLKTEDNQQVQSSDAQYVYADPDKKIVDYYGNTEGRFSHVNIGFRSLSDKLMFCSMYISGGRVLIPDPTPTTIPEDTADDPKKAMDGELSPNDKNCYKSYPTTSRASVQFTFSPPFIPQAYKIFGRNDEEKYKCKLRYFQLDVNGTNGEVIEQRKLSNIRDIVPYTVFPVSYLPASSVAITVAKEYWTNKQYTCDEFGLVLCEIMVLGDFACNKAFGFECEKACNCKDQCSVLGICPTECEEGYSGVDCQIGGPPKKPILTTSARPDLPETTLASQNRDPDRLCAFGKWGPQCKEDCHCKDECDSVTGVCSSICQEGFSGPSCQKRGCSENCFVKGLEYETVCDPLNRTCHSGCKTGFKGPTCEEKSDIVPTSSTNCTLKQYGSDCQYDCSDNCGGLGYCYVSNGECFQGCLPGYTGDRCEQECTPNTWGFRCINNCSVLCGGNGLCNHITGICDQGCDIGGSGDTCEVLGAAVLSNDNAQSRQRTLSYMAVIFLVVITLARTIYKGRRESEIALQEERERISRQILAEQKRLESLKEQTVSSNENIGDIQEPNDAQQQQEEQQTQDERKENGEEVEAEELEKKDEHGVDGNDSERNTTTISEYPEVTRDADEDVIASRYA